MKLETKGRVIRFGGLFGYSVGIALIGVGWCMIAISKPVLALFICLIGLVIACWILSK